MRQVEVEILRQSLKDLSKRPAGDSLSFRRPAPLPSIDYLNTTDSYDAATWNAKSDVSGRRASLSPSRRARGDGAESRSEPRLELEEARSRVAAGKKRIAQLESWLDKIYGDGGELGIGPGRGVGGVRFDDLPSGGIGLPSITDSLQGGGGRSQRSTAGGRSLQSTRTGRTPRN